ncbi:MAG: hypothetical protein JRN06_04965 [Nitrososphaerota archaeon]|nr:hypothetical protein [Nitrososphaerota archaeon]MDG7023969.1 hypothetical protein [Nitrososphaerota archaeon]
MLSFRVHQLRIGRLHYLLLPKMTRAQMNVISRRVSRAGYSVELSSSLSARSGQGTIQVDPSGVCRSTVDIADLIVPAVPDILACDRERIPLGELESLYLTTDRSGRKSRVRISTRTESFLLWEIMRASGDCGLSPDEHAVATFLLERASGTCGVLTDFPEDGSVARMVEGRRYFDSKISPAMAAKTLRVAGTKYPKNSYLRRDGILELSDIGSSSAGDWLDLFDELGEWCYFTPE